MWQEGKQPRNSLWYDQLRDSREGLQAYRRYPLECINDIAMSSHGSGRLRIWKHLVSTHLLHRSVLGLVRRQDTIFKALYL